MLLCFLCKKAFLQKEKVLSGVTLPSAKQKFKFEHFYDGCAVQKSCEQKMAFGNCFVFCFAKNIALHLVLCKNVFVTFYCVKCSASHFSKENVRTCFFLFCFAKNTKKERYQNVFWLCKNTFLHHKGANCSATRKDLDFVKM